MLIKYINKYDTIYIVDHAINYSPEKQADCDKLIFKATCKCSFEQARM